MLPFNEKLRVARKELGITQKQAATDLDTSERNYQHYEAGTSKPSFDFLPKLCRYFNVSADYLLGLSDEPVARRKDDPLAPTG